MDTPLIAGREWLIEASGCNADKLRDQTVLQSVFSSIIDELGLKTVGQPIWHKFPGEGGVTGLVALTESHLACHTYPEHNFATFNLYCCKDRPEWEWEERLSEMIDARSVSITKIIRSTPADAKPHSNTTVGNSIDIEVSVAGGDA